MCCLGHRTGYQDILSTVTTTVPTSLGMHTKPKCFQNSSLVVRILDSLSMPSCIYLIDCLNFYIKQLCNHFAT